MLEPSREGNTCLAGIEFFIVRGWFIIVFMKRPYVFIVTGISLDGKISNYKREQSEIATNDDRKLIIDSRTRADAVMIGGASIQKDDPKLSLKNEEYTKIRLNNGKSRQPITVAVISDAGNIKKNGDYLGTDAKKVVFTTERSNKETVKKLNCLKNVSVYVLGKNRVDLKKALNILSDLGVKELMVEGGGELNYSLIKENLVDEINIKIGNLVIGGKFSPTLADGEGFEQKDFKKFNLVSCKKSNNYVVLKYLK